jgi:hypothetical protein
MLSITLQTYQRHLCKLETEMTTNKEKVDQHLEVRWVCRVPTSRTAYSRVESGSKDIGKFVHRGDSSLVGGISKNITQDEVWYM